MTRAVCTPTKNLLTGAPKAGIVVVRPAVPDGSASIGN
jgi:hypothetical protein